jgi:hypothetical protein
MNCFPVHLSFYTADCSLCLYSVSNNIQNQYFSVSLLVDPCIGKSF